MYLWFIFIGFFSSFIFPTTFPQSWSDKVVKCFDQNYIFDVDYHNDDDDNDEDANDVDDLMYPLFIVDGGWSAWSKQKKKKRFSRLLINTL